MSAAAASPRLAWNPSIAVFDFAPITPSLPPVSKPRAVSSRCNSCRSALVSPVASGPKEAFNGPAPASRSLRCPTPRA